MDRNRWIFIAIVASALILTWKVTIAQTAADEDVIYCLAKQHFKYESIGSEEEKRAFDTFFQKTQQGEQANLTPDLKTVTDPAHLNILADPVHAVLWERDRVIKADWLLWLCTDPKASGKVTSKGIEIAGARIDGTVDLKWLKIQFPLRTYKCAFTGRILLEGASLRSLQLPDTHIKDLDADGLTVERDVFLSGDFRAEGAVSFQDATIGGRLSCAGGQFIPLKPKPALNLRYAKIGTSLRLGKLSGKGFRAEGEVRLLEATIGGDLDCCGGHFINPQGRAIEAGGVDVQGSVLLGDGFEADGEVSFQGARIGQAFRLQDVVWGQNACLDLRSAKVKTLLNQEKSWPGKDKLLLHGFVFDEFDIEAQPRAETQDAWIQRQPRKQFQSQPYEQTAEVLRKMGMPDQAVKVLIEKNLKAGRFAISNNLRQIGKYLEKIGKPYAWQQLRSLEYSGKLLRDLLKVLWGICWYFFGWLIGYGYRPWGALGPSIILILIGWIRFRNGYKARIIIPAKDDAWLAGAEPRQLKPSYPRFSAIIYSLEKFVPLVKLDVGDFWTPDANQRAGRRLRRFLLFHMIAGWVLTTLWVGGLTGLIKT